MNQTKETQEITWAQVSYDSFNTYGGHSQATPREKTYCRSCAAPKGVRMKLPSKYKSGWHNDSHRHFLAAKFGSARTNYWALKPLTVAQNNRVSDLLDSDRELGERYVAAGSPKMAYEDSSHLFSPTTGEVINLDGGEDLVVLSQPALIANPVLRTLWGGDEAKQTLRHELRHVEQNNWGVGTKEITPAIEDAYPDLTSSRDAYYHDRYMRHKSTSLSNFKPTEWDAYDNGEKHIFFPVRSDFMIDSALKSPEQRLEAKELRLNYEAGLDFAREHPDEDVPEEDLQ
jgi:hypothetical protein